MVEKWSNKWIEKWNTKSIEKWNNKPNNEKRKMEMGLDKKTSRHWHHLTRLLCTIVYMKLKLKIQALDGQKEASLRDI